MDAVETLIARLYRGSTEVGMVDFKGWALSCLAEVLPFDTAVWIAGTPREIRLDRTTVLGADGDGFLSAFDAAKDEFRLLQLLGTQPGRSVNLADVIPDGQFYASPFYERFANRYQLERVLGTSRLAPDSGLLDVLVLFRNQRNRSFTEQERRLKERLTPHLVEAASHAIFVSLLMGNEPQIADRRQRSAAALCDNQGFLHAVEPRFSELIGALRPGWSGPSLPFDLPNIQGEQSVYSDERLEVLGTRRGDLIWLRALPANPLTSLTTREREIVMGVSEGKTSKAIGKQLDISPSTVNNHVHKIFAKLGINNRSQLVGLARDLAGNN